jgi:NADPH-dependent ferric siderophore reductase
MPRTIRENVIHPITVREVRVRRVEDVTTGMRRVTLAGDQLGAFVSNGFAQPEFRSDGFDDDIRLVFPYPGETEPVLPIQKDGSIEFPKDRRPLSKSYTVRRWDADTGEVDVDFVKHGTGVATTWALRCAPGDRVHIAGPARSGPPSTGCWSPVTRPRCRR